MKVHPILLAFTHSMTFLVSELPRGGSNGMLRRGLLAPRARALGSALP